MAAPAITVRRPAVAGQFYPANRGQLKRDVARYLAEAEPHPEKNPKALVGPHAGYAYSGPIAGSAYAPLMQIEGVERVVLIGPSHYVPFRGIAVPSHEAFSTPLGEVPVDRAAVEQILEQPLVVERDDAHAQEHGLEVHLPFLQSVLGTFRIVPMVTGEIDGASVAEVLEWLWGGPETLIAVSSDLSHFYDYATAQTLDTETSQAILALDPDAISEEGACGRRAIQGLLHCARKRAMRPVQLDLRNSGDTAGNRNRVVGYGAYVFYA